MEYTIKQASRKPITIWYDAHGVTPSRTIRYCKVYKIAGFDPCKVGKVKIAGCVFYVRANRFGNWELIAPIDPVTYSLLKLAHKAH